MWIKNKHEKYGKQGGNKLITKNVFFNLKSGCEWQSLYCDVERSFGFIKNFNSSKALSENFNDKCGLAPCKSDLVWNPRSF